MMRAEGGLVTSGVGYGEGCPLFSQLGGLGERRELPSGVRSRAPDENGFWRILKATERSFLYLTKSAGDNLHYRSLLQILGGRVPPVPRDLRP